jgi:glycosidase
MNYEFRRLILRFFVDEEIDAYRFAQEISKLYIRLSPYHSTSIYNLLESHDTSRFITYAGRNIDKVIQSYAFMFISFGSPSIYYGGEIGLEGNDDPDNRRPMVWDVKHWDNALLSNIIKLIDLRRKFSVFRYGLFLIKPLGPKVVLVIRYLNDVQGYAIFNVGRREYQLHLGEMINLLYDYNTITKYSENGLDTIIGPNGVLVFTPKL